MEPICTYYAFKSYRLKAEQNGLHEFPLYHWTKSTIEDPAKLQKHQKSFAFYLGIEHVYCRAAAEKLYEELVSLKLEDILDIKLINPNPANDPQLPQAT